MNVELLRTIPTSGSVDERHFSVSAGANAWVKFSDDSGLEWVGVFGSGEASRFEAAIPFDDDGGKTVLIVAGGRGYVVDAHSMQLIRRTTRDYIRAAISVPGRDFVIIADWTEMRSVGRESDRRVWRREPAWYSYGGSEDSHRLALDGIVFEAATRDEVHGRVWDGDGWYAFRLNVSDLEFIRESLITADWDAFASSSPAV